mmetsp:Transcript_38120/g.89005  ORF Transcript_38120/g.89005 Transcript_38120/m.89005 type:complete len:315 (-) Transcript_38120:117-1061(-)
MVSQDNVCGEDELDSLRLRLLLEALGELHLVLLDKRVAHLEAPCFEEGEHHAATNHKLVALLHQRLNHANLGGHLGPSNNGSQRPFGIRNRPLQVVKLLLEQQPGNAGREELSHPSSRSVSPVSSPEGIVDEHVKGLRELLGKVEVVLLLLSVKTDVFEQAELTVSQGVHRPLGLLPHAVAAHRDLLSQQLAQPLCAGSERELVLGAVARPSKVGADSQARPLVEEEADGRDGCSDPRVVADGLAVERNIQVATDQHLLSLEIFRGEVRDTPLLDSRTHTQTRRCRAAQTQTRRVGGRRSTSRWKPLPRRSARK